ncbi:MAG: hypothetical protein VX641_07535 [Planctomycetota bacterium]|nr:hypothetical protein [Planctomycetota bacterium]
MNDVPATRRRSLKSRLLLGVGVLAAGLFAGWVVLVSVWGQQTLGPQRNFLEERNARIDSIPPDQRAWPRLRDAVDELGFIPWESFDRQVEELTGSAESTERDRWLLENEEGLASLRSALRRPRLGLAWYPEVPPVVDHFLLLSPEERRSLPLARPADASFVDDESLLINLPLRFPKPMRAMARLLEADALRAARTGAPEQAVDDCIAILDLARLCQQDPMLIAQLSALSIRSLAQQTILEVVSTESVRSNARQLARLAEALSVPISPVSLDGERMILEDIVQRFYTDDGAGDGYLMASKLSNAAYLTNLQLPVLFLPDSSLHSHVLQPVVARSAGSRREVLDAFEELASEHQRLGNADPWQIDWTRLEAMQDGLKSDGLLGALHRFPLPLLAPNYESLVLASQSSRFRHECTKLVVAVHRFRVRTGQWPDRLEQLQPDLLTEVPRDPYDGAFLRYQLRGDQPVIWSIGTDSIDNGGVFDEPTGPFALKRVSPQDGGVTSAAVDQRLWPASIPPSRE